MRVRGIFLLREGEKKVGRLFRSGVGGVLKEVTWGQMAIVIITACLPPGVPKHTHHLPSL